MPVGCLVLYAKRKTLGKTITRLDRNFDVDSWRNLLARGRRLRLQVQTTDMCPRVKPEDIVELEEAQLMHMRKGDLVLVFSRGTLRLRQIKGRELESGAEIFLVGACQAGVSDSTHSFEEILARVVSIEREGETLRACGDSVWKARGRRKLWRYLRNVWHGWLLHFSKRKD